MEHHFQISNRWIGDGEPTYFIAEVGSNFDGSLHKAKDLIKAAKLCGADAVKFQSFRAEQLISPHSFDQLKIGYQTKWKESTYNVYRKAEFPFDWHEEVFAYAKQHGIEFLTSIWDYEALDLMERLGVNAYKIGSGDITWLDFIHRIAETGKPILLSTGASSLADIDKAMQVIRETGNKRIVLMQCVTNYPSSYDNANIRVLETYRKTFDVIVGYSDHSAGDIVALGSVALGAKVIEKHFTLDKHSDGPDHSHSMEPNEFAEMVRSIRQLESALGSLVKQVTHEEHESAIIMRRSIHAAKDINKGEEITADKLLLLRPAVGIPPEFTRVVIGHRAARKIHFKEAIHWDDLG